MPTNGAGSSMRGRTRTIAACSPRPGTRMRSEEIDARRPRSDVGPPRPSPQGAVLVLGVYMAGRPSAIADIVARLGETACWRVDQRWVALGGLPPDEDVARVTTRCIRRLTPKYRLLNELLADAQLDDYDYVVTL